MMVRRQIAHRVGIVGVTGQQVRLAAATAEVPGSFRTAATGLLHPRLAAKTVEGRRVIPDGADVRLTHIGELQSRQHARRVTGHGRAVGRDGEKYRPQAVHARLGPGLEVVRHHEIDLHPAADALAKAPRGLLRPLELCTAGQEVLAVEPRPAVVLRVGELDVLRAHALGHLENLTHVIDIEPVQHHVQHHRIAVLADESGHLRLQLEGARAAQEIIQLARAVLERQLDVIEPGRLQRAHARLGHADAGGDQVDVEPERVRLRDDRLEVLAHQRLPARKPELHRAQGARLAQHADPVLGPKLRPGFGKVRRVVAEHAMQRAAVGQLQQQPKRRPGSARAAQRL